MVQCIQTVFKGWVVIRMRGEEFSIDAYMWKQQWEETRYSRDMTDRIFLRVSVHGIAAVGNGVFSGYNFGKETVSHPS